MGAAAAGVVAAGFFQGEDGNHRLGYTGPTQELVMVAPDAVEPAELTQTVTRFLDRTELAVVYEAQRENGIVTVYDPAHRFGAADAPLVVPPLNQSATANWVAVAEFIADPEALVRTVLPEFDGELGQPVPAELRTFSGTPAVYVSPDIQPFSSGYYLVSGPALAGGAALDDLVTAMQMAGFQILHVLELGDYSSVSGILDSYVTGPLTLVLLLFVSAGLGALIYVYWVVVQPVESRSDARRLLIRIGGTGLGVAGVLCAGLVWFLSPGQATPAGVLLLAIVGTLILTALCLSIAGLLALRLRYRTAHPAQLAAKDSWPNAGKVLGLGALSFMVTLCASYLAIFAVDTVTVTGVLPPDDTEERSYLRVVDQEHQMYNLVGAASDVGRVSPGAKLLLDRQAADPTLLVSPGAQAQAEPAPDQLWDAGTLVFETVHNAMCHCTPAEFQVLADEMTAADSLQNTRRYFYAVDYEVSGNARYVANAANEVWYLVMASAAVGIVACLALASAQRMNPSKRPHLTIAFAYTLPAIAAYQLVNIGVGSTQFPPSMHPVLAGAIVAGFVVVHLLAVRRVKSTVGDLYLQ